MNELTNEGDDDDDTATWTGVDGRCVGGAFGRL